MSLADDERIELAGRTALVTGAGGGIGRAISEVLSARGASVLLVGRRADRLEQTRAGIGECEAPVVVLSADITDATWLEEASELASGIDILVHNAAAYATHTWLEDVPEEEIARVLDTNLLAAIRLTAHCLPGMKERGFGRVIHIGSVAARRGVRGRVAYTATKAGLEGLMRSTAVEGARHGVTSNLLELGLIETERVVGALKEKIRRRMVDSTPVGRIGRPEEVADAAAFLASPRASYITGAVLPVSGGLGLGLYPEQLG